MKGIGGPLGYGPTLWVSGIIKKMLTSLTMVGEEHSVYHRYINHNPYPFWIKPGQGGWELTFCELEGLHFAPAHPGQGLVPAKWMQVLS